MKCAPSPPSHDTEDAPLERRGRMLGLPNGTWISADAVNVVKALRQRGPGEPGGAAAYILIETPRGQWKCPVASFTRAVEMANEIAAIAAEHGTTAVVVCEGVP